MNRVDLASRRHKKEGVPRALAGVRIGGLWREDRQIARLRSLARDANLDPDFAETFLNFIVKEVIRHHEAIRG